MPSYIITIFSQAVRISNTICYSIVVQLILKYIWLRTREIWFVFQFSCCLRKKHSSFSPSGTGYLYLGLSTSTAVHYPVQCVITNTLASISPNIYLISTFSSRFFHLTTNSIDDISSISTASRNVITVESVPSHRCSELRLGDKLDEMLRMITNSYHLLMPYRYTRGERGLSHPYDYRIVTFIETE